MDADKHFSVIAGLIGEKSRLMMLWHLLDDKALPATELAMAAGVSPQSASMHLNKLVDAGLLSVAKQGRQRFYKLAGPEAAYAVEAITNLLPAGTAVGGAPVKSTIDIRNCRTCYDHLAGKVSVGVTGELLKRKIIMHRGAEFELTKEGSRWFSEFGVDVGAAKNLHRSFARACLDWSERKPHLAGALGAALLNTMFENDWIRRVKNSRSILITPKGRRRFYDCFGLSV